MVTVRRLTKEMMMMTTGKHMKGIQETTNLRQYHWLWHWEHLWPAGLPQEAQDGVSGSNSSRASKSQAAAMLDANACREVGVGVRNLGATCWDSSFQQPSQAPATPSLSCGKKK